MTIKWIYYSSIILVATFISFGFKAAEPSNRHMFDNSNGLLHLFPSEQISAYPATSILYTGKSFVGFKEALAFKESQGKYGLINSFGYMGKYQFGREALKAIGITNTSLFLKSPELQEKAFAALLAKNKFLLRNELEQYEGQIVAGVRVTESGVLAAAHLVGAGSVKKFFRTNGKAVIKDGYGTSLRSYLKNYGGYDTSHIEPKDQPEVTL